MIKRVRKAVLKTLHIGVDEASGMLGIDLSDFVNEKSSLKDTTPESWIDMQDKHDFRS